MISHATYQETQRQTHLLDVFSGPMISHATSQETQRQTHLLDAFSGPLISQKRKDFYLPPRLQSAFIPCITSFSYCFSLGMFLHLSVHKFQVYYHLHTIVNSLLILNSSQKISSLTS